VGPVLGGLDLRFGSHFVGQVPGSEANPVVRHAANTVRFGSLFNGQVAGKDPNTLYQATVTSPLTLHRNGPRVATAADLAVRSIVLGGAEYVGKSLRYFATPLVILFHESVASLGFKLGAIDHVRSFVVVAFDRNGTSLGFVQNTADGFERIGLASRGTPIAGGSITITADHTVR